MAVVQSFDHVNRRIVLMPGVTSFHPVDDIYKEYRIARRTNESMQVFASLMRAEGNIAKGSGRFTERYLVLLGGAKIVPQGDVPVLDVGGVIVTDDQSNPFYTSMPRIDYTPSAAEIIAVDGSGAGTGSVDLSPVITRLESLLDVNMGNWRVVGSQMIFYRRDGAELMRFDLVDKDGVPTLSAPAARVRV